MTNRRLLRVMFVVSVIALRRWLYKLDAWLEDAGR